MIDISSLHLRVDNLLLGTHAVSKPRQNQNVPFITLFQQREQNVSKSWYLLGAAATTKSSALLLQRRRGSSGYRLLVGTKRILWSEFGQSAARYPRWSGDRSFFEKREKIKGRVKLSLESGVKVQSLNSGPRWTRSIERVIVSFNASLDRPWIMEILRYMEGTRLVN